MLHFFFNTQTLFSWVSKVSLNSTNRNISKYFGRKWKDFPTSGVTFYLGVRRRSEMYIENIFLIKRKSAYFACFDIKRIIKPFSKIWQIRQMLRFTQISKQWLHPNAFILLFTIRLCSFSLTMIFIRLEI